jgi:hypothetical protein
VLHKRFGQSELFVCESTAYCAISNPQKRSWEDMESFIEQGNYIPKYVFALSSNEFAIELQHRFNLDLRTRDGNLILQTFQ